ncbi:MAG: hypothetical protein H0W74_03610 [Sphingosinicella sp.]|nr:hypothetical protein [Sphingosinicella sp.]
MISLALVTAMSLGAAQADPTILPRKSFASCLSSFKKKSLEQRMEAAAFSVAVKSACETEATSLRQALIALDVKRGGKRAEALSNADFDLQGYRENMDESYRDSIGPAPQ